MPRYTYGCPKCGVFERIFRVSDHSNIVTCECGEEARQIITPVTVVIPSHMSATGVSAYESPVSGQIITSQQQRRNDMAAHDCIEYDPGMKQDADRRVIEEEKRLDALVDDHVEREFAAMPTEKLERLSNEIEAGASAEITRL